MTHLCMSAAEKRKLEKLVEKDEDFWDEFMLVPIDVDGIREVVLHTSIQDLEENGVPKLSLTLNGVRQRLIRKSKPLVGWSEVTNEDSDSDGDLSLLYIYI